MMGNQIDNEALLDNLGKATEAEVLGLSDRMKDLSKEEIVDGVVDAFKNVIEGKLTSELTGNSLEVSSSISRAIIGFMNMGAISMVADLHRQDHNFNNGETNE